MTFSFYGGVGFAVEGEQGSGDAAGQTVQETTAPANSDNQGAEGEAADTDNPSEEPSENSGTNGQKARGTGDGDSDTGDGQLAGEEPATEDSEEPMQQEPTRATLPSGNLNNGWVWKVVGEEGDYTLTFEYTGDGTPSNYTIPANFVANISSQLGDVQSQITKVVIPEKCTTIGTRAFQNLKKLEEVEIASTVTTIGTVVFGDNQANNASLRDTNLKKVTIKTGSDGKSSLQRIEAGAFTGCTSLTSINLEDTKLNYIGVEVFRSTKLSDVYLPDTMATSGSGYLGNYAFADNSNLESANLPALFYYSTAGTYLFSNCSKLEDVDFRTVNGASARNTAATSLPNYTFQNCTNLKHVDLSAWEKSNYSSSYNYFQINYNTFIGTNLNNLEELILPKKEIRIAANTFLTTNSSPYQGKTGIESFDQFVNHEYITTIGDRAFYGTRIEEGPTSDMTRLTSIGMEAFKNCDDMTELVIPEKVTSIGSAAFKNCDNLETVRIEATSLTTMSTANFFDGDDNLKEVTISSQTKKLNGNMLAAIPDYTDTFFEGENVIEIIKATANRGTRPLKGMEGKYYVDSQGVLYKLNEETGKASLAYVPPGITSYTVPETITTPGDSGTEFTVSAIDAYALNLADDLTAITFAKPENIYLKPQAFSGWSKSTDNMGKTVNGKDAIDPDDGWARYSSVCDFPIKDETGKLVPFIEDKQENADGDEVLKVVIVVNDKNPSEDNTYDYKTGQKASYMIAISNEDNTVLDKVVRVYFSYSDAGYNMGTFTEGTKPIVANGKTYPCKVVRTDNPNIYYYEITGIDPGETVAFDNDIFYPSPGTGGGEVKIWTHTLSSEDAEALEGDVINPKNYMELDWDTDPVEYKLTKATSTLYDTQTAKQQSPIIKSDTSGDAYVSALAWRITESNVGSAPVTEGLDYIKWVNYEDIITLPDELYWKQEVLDAIESGSWTVENTTTYYYGTNSTIACKAITVTVNGTKYYVAYLANPTGYGRDGIENLKARVTDDGKVKLTWKVSNDSLSGASATSEFKVQSFYLRVGDGVLLADLDKVNDLMEENPGEDLKTLLKVHNDSDEVRHYSYSPNQTAASSVDSPIDAKYDVDIRKDWAQNSDTTIEGGKDDFFNISINNTGILRLSTWGKPTTDGEGNTIYDGQIIHDSLHKNMYIMPGNIENMFNAVVTAGSGTNSQRVPIGDWLKLTITSASLFTVEQYQPVDGTSQNNKYTTGSDSNINANADNGFRKYQGAKMVFQKNAAGKIEVTLSGDTIAENNRTYVIGSDGDYPSVDAFFTAIGYMPTVDTIYTVDYNVPVDTTFTLQPGQKITFPIRTTYKTTPMRTTVDTRYALSDSTSNSSVNATTNTATVSLKAGEKNISEQVFPYYMSGSSKYRQYHYWQRDLYLSKTGYIQLQNSSITTSTIIEDGTVIDNSLYFWNKSLRAYDHMQVSDYSDGPQVVLVPAAQNQGLVGPDGNEPEMFGSNGVIYYLLNKIGTYENVTLGSTTGRNGTQTLKADVTVTETKSGNKRTSLNTLIKWKPFENWGATTTANYIYYKVLVSGDKAGFASASNPGEVERYTLNNKAWLGDHQGHRLWDTYGMYLQVYNFSKKILTEDGDLVSSSRLKASSKVTYQIEINSTSDSPTVLSGNRIKDTLPRTYGVFDWAKGGNVTNLRYIGSDGVTITYGSGDSAVDIPVDGSASSTNDYWNIANNTPSSGYQQIQWNNKFNVHFPERGTLKILVDLEFPSRPDNGASVWDQYVAANAGKTLYNTFYLDTRQSSVSHVLESEGKAVLYKGVYDNGITTKNPSNSDTSSWKYGLYTSNNTRLLYENGTGNNAIGDSNLKASTITYYTVLYNGSYDRLYLSVLEDELPRGFTYNSMCYTSATHNEIDNTSSYYTGWLGYRSGSYNTSVTTESRGNTSEKLVTIDKSGDPYDNNTVSYKSAYVSPSVSTVNGRQHIAFTVTGVSYDEEVGKYYLNPGECLRFGYNVLINTADKTGDDPNDPDGAATNTITMPYYDYYGTGFILDKPDEDGKGGAIQKARPVSGITPNDGTCDMMTAEEVNSQYGINTSRYSAPQYSTLEGGNYMVSSVTVERAPIVPGLNKTIGGLTQKLDAPTVTATSIEGSQGSASAANLYGSAYKGGAKSSDVVNWKLRVYNETVGKNENASGMMTNYKVVDTVDAPYKFTGQVFFNLYKAGSANGTRATSASQYLFTIGSRKTTDTSVRFSSGSTLSNTGFRNVRIGDANDDSDDDWFSFGSGTTGGKVKLEKDADGNEVLTILMTGTAYSIPAGHWADYCVHTMYPTNPDDNSTVVVVSDTKYNNALLYPEQYYDSTKVAQGRARTKQEYNDEGELVTVNDGIQSGASITITQGYTTSSWKKITEIGNSSNTAQSDNPDNNCIPLSEKTKNVRYDMYVIGPQAMMSKIVIIDDLPREGDHSAFVEKDLRYSDFSVGLLEDNLDLKVYIAKKTGTSNGANTYGSDTLLDPSKYDAYVSTKTEFTKDGDWEGVEDNTWTKLSGLSDEEMAAALKSAKSIRVVIKDPAAWIKENDSNYLMSAECRLRVSFNARINDPEAEPGEIAWNSFGYKYQVPKIQGGTEENSYGISLEAQPLNVGLQYPCAPILKKKLTEEVTEIEKITDPESGETTTQEVTKVVSHPTERDLNCNFLIYEGEPLSSLNDISSMTNSQIADVLDNADRKYVYIPCTIDAGESEYEMGLWTLDYCSTYEGGKFKDSEQRWTWVHNARYTLLELNMADEDVYDLNSISVEGTVFNNNNQSFANDATKKIELTADNRYSNTDLILTKKMPKRADTSFSENAETNSTVVFKVIGKNKAGKVKYENTVGISFNNETGASETRVLKNVPSDLEITVKEVYAGNYKPKDGTTSITKTKVEKYEGDLEEVQGKTVWVFEFENELEDNQFGSGIVNKYENKDGTVTYNGGNDSGSEPDEPKN